MHFVNEKSPLSPNNKKMRAMVFTGVGNPLELRELSIPHPGPKQVLIKVAACGICRTDLHIVDGELKLPKLPLVLGHQIAGTIIELGEEVSDFKVGDRIGVPWLGGSCGVCTYCRAGKENQNIVLPTLSLFSLFLLPIPICKQHRCYVQD
jgi:D-arabinose 1-dehydrogenase-like Zn-dependent alcohol dehydrogenase